MIVGVQYQSYCNWKKVSIELISTWKRRTNKIDKLKSMDINSRIEQAIKTIEEFEKEFADEDE